MSIVGIIVIVIAGGIGAINLGYILYATFMKDLPER